MADTPLLDTEEQTATEGPVEGEVLGAEQEGQLEDVAGHGAIVPVQRSVITDPKQLGGMWGPLTQISQDLFNSGLCPESLRNWQAVALVALKGMELGLGPVQSLMCLHVVKGRVGMAAETMRALVYERCQGGRIIEHEATETICRLEGQRPGQEPKLAEFSIEDAQAQGLVKSGSAWEKDPKDMLYARATSRLCRRQFPDVIMGCYTPEELRSITPEPASTPDADPMAPAAPSRTERSGDAEPTGQAACATAEYRALLTKWKAKNPEGAAKHFAQWANDITGGVTDLAKPEGWSMPLIRTLAEAVQ